MSKPGYTLPVFACAAAVAAVQHLQQQSVSQVSVDLIEPPIEATIDIEQVAALGENQVLAIARSDPGEHLDITRHTPVWAMVSLQPSSESESSIIIQGGEGIGRTSEDQAAIYRYAQRLMQHNLQPLIEPNQTLWVTIILPEGKSLAARTSNAAFGVVEGLSLLGTSGIVKPLTAPEQLEKYRQELAIKAEQSSDLVFCIGENGLALAEQKQIPAAKIVKTANWIGSMLVEAAALGVESIVLWGYHGKLIKLAGGIFHTHHSLADARQEIMTAYCANLELPYALLQQIFTAPTTEAALNLLQNYSSTTEEDWVDAVYGAIARSINRRTRDYIYHHTAKQVEIGCVLFDRQRQIIVTDPIDIFQRL